MKVLPFYVSSFSLEANEDNINCLMSETELSLLSVGCLRNHVKLIWLLENFVKCDFQQSFSLTSILTKFSNIPDKLICITW